MDETGVPDRTGMQKDKRWNQGQERYRDPEHAAIVLGK